MKKINILFLGVIIVLGLLLISGCGKTKQTKPVELLDTLVIDRGCPSTNESLNSCCDSLCTKFCKDNNRPKFKNEINVKEPVRHCICWCV